MSKAILPDGSVRNSNFAIGWDTADKNGPGFLQWGGGWTDQGFPQYHAHFASVSEEKDEGESTFRFDFDGPVSIVAYDDGKPLPSLLPQGAREAGVGTFADLEQWMRGDFRE